MLFPFGVKTRNRKPWHLVSAKMGSSLGQLSGRFPKGSSSGAVGRYLSSFGCGSKKGQPVSPPWKLGKWNGLKPAVHILVV